MAVVTRYNPTISSALTRALAQVDGETGVRLNGSTVGTGRNILTSLSNTGLISNRNGCGKI